MISEPQMDAFRAIADSFGPDSATPNRIAFNAIHSLLNGYDSDTKQIADLQEERDMLDRTSTYWWREWHFASGRERPTATVAGVNEACKRMDAKDKERDDLQAIVAKLPTDAEGVHCVPGDKRWAITQTGDGTEIALHGVVTWMPVNEPPFISFGILAYPVIVEAGYDTKEAAEAAREVSHEQEGSSVEEK